MGLGFVPRGMPLVYLECTWGNVPGQGEGAKRMGKVNNRRSRRALGRFVLGFSLRDEKGLDSDFDVG